MHDKAYHRGVDQSAEHGNASMEPGSVTGINQTSASLPILSLACSTM
jgi:hypothetical protein